MVRACLLLLLPPMLLASACGDDLPPAEMSRPDACLEQTEALLAQEGRTDAWCFWWFQNRCGFGIIDDTVSTDRQDRCLDDIYALTDRSAPPPESCMALWLLPIPGTCADHDGSATGSSP